MELNAIEQGVIVDRAGVGGASAKGLSVRLTGESEVFLSDRRERQLVDLVDLDPD